MNVLVVCLGNLNRSPLCEAVLRRAGLDARSAGFGPSGLRAAAKTREWAMIQQKLDLSQHRSTQLYPKLHEWADYVVFMNHRHRARYEGLLLSGPTYTPIILLGHYASPQVDSIPDPGFMECTSPKFRETLALVVAASERLAERLKAGNV